MISSAGSFEKSEDPSGTVCILPDCSSDLASLNLKTFSDWMSFNGGALVDRNSRRSVVRLRLRRTYFLKRFHKPPLKDFLFRWLAFRSAPTHAATEIAAAASLEKAGIGTYRIVGFGEAASGAARKSFLLTEELEGFAPLSVIVAAMALKTPAESLAIKKAVLAPLARLARKMHLAGITHPDFFSTHVFVLMGAGGPEFRVIDLHRCAEVRRISRFHAARDLAALHLTSARPQITRADRLRFLREYLGRDSLDADVRVLARKIASRSERVGVRSKYRGYAPREEP